MPRPAKCRGCKGRSPLHKITLRLPLPRRGRALCERGSGGYPSPSGKGAESKLKAGQAGDLKGKPPMQTSQRQCQPATPGGKPSPGACFSGSASAASGSVPGYLHGRVCKCRKRSNAGVPGAVAPGKIILESPPSPPGKGAGGIGGRIQKLKAGQTGIQKGKPPMQTSQRQVKPIPQKTKGNTENSTQSTVDNTPGFML